MGERRQSAHKGTLMMGNRRQIICEEMYVMATEGRTFTRECLQGATFKATITLGASFSLANSEGHNSDTLETLTSVSLN